MVQTRPGHSLFAGAKVSLGPVNLSGRNYDDYKLSEIAFIVGRYMVQHSEDNKVYIGSVPAIVAKMWPERWEYDTFTDSRDAKRIYFWLKQYGFKSHRGQITTWFLPGDLDTAYADRVLLRGTTDPKDVPIAPVTIRCLCGEGPFDSQAKFEAHRQEKHGEVKVEAGEVKEEPLETAGEQLAIADAGAEMTSCPVCTLPVSKAGLRSHLYAQHQKEQCPKCGKLLAIGGLGGHAQKHKLPRTQRLLLNLMREMGDGLPPGEYQKRIDVLLGQKRSEGGHISHLAKGLAERGYIRVEGKTSATRWYLTAKGRGKGGNGTTPMKAEAPKKPQKKQLPKAVPEPQANPLMNIPGGKQAQVFETKEGAFILVVDGKTYFVTQMSELVS